MFKEEIKNFGLDLFVPNLYTDLQGFLFIFIVCFITNYLILRKPEIRNILIAALTIRTLFIIIGHYFFHLPDTKADALGYEWSAWNMGKDGFVNTIQNFTGPGSEFYGWLMAIPYSIFGRNILILQSIGMFFGIASVYLAYSLSERICGKEAATKAGWLVALFPSSILYSVIILKEVYCSFFLLLGVMNVVDWVDQKKLMSAFFALMSFMIAGFFHGPLFLGILLFVFFLFINSIKKIIKSLLELRLHLTGLIFLFLVIYLVIYLFSNQIYLPYIGTLELIDFSTIASNVTNRMRGDASYPQWLLIETPTEFIYKSLIRILYLLFSPFPWAIKEPTHIIGTIDGILYMILLSFIIFNIKTLYEYPLLRIILVFLFFYLFIYGIGVGNFGAGIRHRSKFIIEIIILSAPFIPKIIFSKNKKKI
jgi:4-amino-4-deoxy-L-arabinose transferase-like glycosyltransferase